MAHPLPGLARLVPSFYVPPRRYRSIVERASSISGFTQAEIAGEGKTRDICRVRFAIMLVLRRRGLSLPAIGRLLRRDHSTIMSGLVRAGQLLETDPDFGALLDLVAIK